MNVGIAITKNQIKFERLIQNLKQKFNIYNFIYLADENAIIQNINKLDILLSYHIPRDIFNQNISSLKWIQLGNAGVDNCMFEQVIKSKIIITNSRGINSVPVAEFVMSAILFFTKNITDCIEFQKNKIWTQWEIAKRNDTLENKIIGIIGYGAIGKAIAKRAKSFNMKIYATKRLQKKTISNSTTDLLLPLKDIDYILKNSDYIVIACPLTPLTYQLINKKKINQCKPSAYIINISRGGIIDEEALCTALKNKKIKGAALDVFNKEPLNQKNALFNLNNVLLSPHISGNFKDYQFKVIESFEKNLERFINKKPLQNRVCKKRLY
tara:strand:+ start:17219 stop:18193 length:975 start_codon:yes stop_codon:yes gene_type:complete